MTSEALIRKKFRALKATMDERMTRLWAGAEAEAMGHGGLAAVSRATGLAISTIQKGRNELRAGAKADDLVRVRRKGGGRRKHEQVHPDLLPALQSLSIPRREAIPSRRCAGRRRAQSCFRRRCSTRTASA